MAKPKSLDEKIDALTILAERNDTKNDSLSSLVGKSFAAVSEDLALRPTTATVSTLLSEQLQPIHRELRILRVELDHLREKVDNIVGFRVEIDHALDRIAAIEKHLGIAKRSPFDL